MASGRRQGFRKRVKSAFLPRRTAVPIQRTVALCLLSLGLFFGGPGSSAAEPAAATDWGATLERDARAFHAALAARHPGPVDPENPGFGAQLDAALARALERVPATRDYGGYWWALREFRAAFNDGHVQVVQQPAAPGLPSRWPGFLTALRDGGYVVATRQDAPGQPAVGARLTGCDGVAADALAQARLGQFHGRWQLASQRQALAGRLFVDAGNPWSPAPRECSFEHNGIEQSVRLEWRDIAEDALETELANLRGARPQDTGVRALDDGALLWIRMAGFNGDPASEDHARLTVLLSQLDDGQQVAAARRVVLDVRGNGGGSSHWSREIAARLWGDAAVAAVPGGSDAVDWRVAEGNLATIQAFRAMLLEQESPDPELLHWSRIIADGLAEALQRGDDLWRQPGDEDSPVAESESAPRPRQLRDDARIIVLTDGVCASACLDALDLWLPLGALHAGGETSADTVYMEIGSQELPSGLSRIGIPMKVYRGRPRGNNEPYVPDHPFPPGSLDESALQSWIRRL